MCHCNLFGKNVPDFFKRYTISNGFKRQSIDTELLLRISIILGRNFFLLYENEYVHRKQE